MREFVQEYNERRLHSAIGYITPADKLAGRADEIFAGRDRKLDQARHRRAERRRAVQTADRKTGEEARQEVHVGANEHLLECVDTS